MRLRDILILPWRIAGGVWREVYANVYGEDFEYKYSTTPDP